MASIGRRPCRIWGRSLKCAIATRLFEMGKGKRSAIAAEDAVLWSLETAGSREADAITMCPVAALCRSSTFDTSTANFAKRTNLVFGLSLT